MPVDSLTFPVGGPSAKIILSHVSAEHPTRHYRRSENDAAGRSPGQSADRIRDAAGRPGRAGA
jgi:hypothetical protein